MEAVEGSDPSLITLTKIVAHSSNMKPCARIILLANALFVLVTGCTSVKDIQTFGKATAAATAAASKGYSDYVRDYTDARREGISVSDTPLKSTDLERPFENSRAGEALTGALDQLGKYATTLEALATKDASADIKAVALDVKTNLTALNASVHKVSPKTSAFSESDISTISGAVAAVADIYVEHLREEALKKVILQADPGVQTVVAVLVRRFPALGTDLQKAMLNAEADYLSALKINVAKLSIDQRVAFGRRAQELHDNSVAAPGTYAAVAALAEKVGAAHAKLAVAAKGGKLTTKETIAAIGEVIIRAEKVKKLFNEVSKAK